MNQEPLHIQLLGRFSVWVKGVAIPEQQWRSKRARNLVKILSLAPGQRLQRDQLIEALWPDSDFSAAANNLHQTLYNARKVFEAAGMPALRLKEGLLSLGDGISVDVAAFESAAARAQKSQDPASYQEALDLYSGDLLPEDLYEEWSIPHRESLRRLHLKLLLELAHLQETRREYPAAIETLQKVLVLDRAHEEAHTALMRVYALAGQRQQALRQFQLLKEALKSELDAGPGPAALRLIEDIQTGRVSSGTEAAVSPQKPGASPALPAAVTRLHNLPAQLTSFVGRQKEIDELNRRVRDQRLVTLTGAGGTGKTRLALKVAEGLLEAFRDGVFLIELAPISDPALISQACIETLKLVHLPGTAPQTILQGYLEKKQLLLLLDNCEHLIHACTSLVSSLLKNCPQLHILATSREILSVPGESPFRVPSLAFPDPFKLPPLEVLDQLESIRLFVERAAQVSPGFILSNDNAAAVAQICLHLDGIPLAIELAAARVRLLSAEQIAARLDNTFHLLTGGSKAVLPRQQTLKATIDWSYELLTAQERLLLQRLSVFAGGWTLEAAETVCADGAGKPAGKSASDRIEAYEVLDLLGQLLDKSMVGAGPGAGDTRYRMLETVRQYSRDRLLEAGGSQGVRGRHLEYFASLTRRAEPHLRGRGQVEWLERLDEELDNLRAALEWSLPARVELGLQIAADLMWFWHPRALYQEAYEWLEKLLDAEAVQRGGQPPVGERGLQRARGLRVQVFSDTYMNSTLPLSGQIALEQESITILRSLQPVQRRELSISLFFLLLIQGNLDQPSPLHDEMLEILREQEDPFYLGEYFYVTASTAPSYEEMIARENASLKISREIEDWDGIASRCEDLGVIKAQQGDYSGAEALLLEALAACRKVKHRWFEAAILLALSKLALAQGNYSEATHQAEASINKYCETNFHYVIGEQLEVLRIIAWSQGNYQEAIHYANEVLLVAYGQKAYEAIANDGLGRVAIAQGDLPRAETLLRQVTASISWKDFRTQNDIKMVHLLGWIRLLSQQRKYRRCARLIGAVHSTYLVISAGECPRVRSEFEEDLAAARAALGEAAFGEEFAAGKVLSLDDALEWVGGG